MTTTGEARPSRRIWRSIGAVVAGLAANVVLAMAADQVAYAADLFPRPPAITYETTPYVIATLYRALFGVAGAWLTARLAPSGPMRHAMILGGIGLLLSGLGLLAAMTMQMGPVWYPAALVAVTLPCAWAGGKLGGRR